jgi:hypothetical protein
LRKKGRFAGPELIQRKWSGRTQKNERVQRQFWIFWGPPLLISKDNKMCDKVDIEIFYVYGIQFALILGNASLHGNK